MIGPQGVPGRHGNWTLDCCFRFQVLHKRKGGRIVTLFLCLEFVSLELFYKALNHANPAAILDYTPRLSRVLHLELK